DRLPRHHVGAGDGREAGPQLSEERALEMAAHEILPRARVDDDGLATAQELIQRFGGDGLRLRQRAQERWAVAVLPLHPREVKRRLGLAGKDGLHERLLSVRSRPDGAVVAALVADSGLG